MLFVTLGTQDKCFKRPLEALEEHIKNGDIKDEIIVQAGHTKFESKYMKILDYIPYDEFSKYIEKADVVITHGGVGNILSSIKLHKKIIAIPRLAKYGEHINDHQLQIISKMAQDGYIIDGSNLDKLPDNIEKAKRLEVKEFVSNTDNFLDRFEKELDKLLG